MSVVQRFNGLGGDLEGRAGLVYAYVVLGRLWNFSRSACRRFVACELTFTHPRLAACRRPHEVLSALGTAGPRLSPGLGPMVGPRALSFIATNWASTPTGLVAATVPGMVPGKGGATPSAAGVAPPLRITDGASVLHGSSAVQVHRAAAAVRKTRLCSCAAGDVRAATGPLATVDARGRTECSRPSTPRLRSSAITRSILGPPSDRSRLVALLRPLRGCGLDRSSGRPGWAHA